jgi:hypothetical protein
MKQVEIGYFKKNRVVAERQPGLIPVWHLYMYSEQGTRRMLMRDETVYGRPYYWLTFMGAKSAALRNNVVEVVK